MALSCGKTTALRLTSVAALRWRSAAGRSPAHSAAVPRLLAARTGTTSAPAIPSAPSAAGSTGMERYDRHRRLPVACDPGGP